MDGIEIVVVNLDGQFYAVEDVCTHDGGPLGEGKLDGCELICPRHGARFDVRTGAATRMPAIEPVPTYEVRVEDGDVLVEVILTYAEVRIRSTYSVVPVRRRSLVTDTPYE